MTETAESTAEASTPHEFDYYHREGMPLRPAPPRIVSSPDWHDLRRRVLAARGPVAAVPTRTALTARIDDHFWEGDEAIDKVVALAKPVGARRVRGMLEQAIAHGIESVEDAPEELVELFAQLDRLPEWFDPEQWERGRVALANATSFGSMGGQLVNVVMTTQGTAVGSATGASGRFVKDYYRRSVETIEFFRVMSRPGAWKRDSEGFATTVRVRYMHGLVRARLRERWGDEAFARHGNPISNSDMALGVPAYSTINLLIDNALGHNHSQADLDAATAYWAYNAYLFGINEAIIPRSAEESVEMFDYVLSTLGADVPQWAPELSETFSRSLTSSTSGGEGVPSWKEKHIVLPLTVGFVHRVCGSPVSNRMLGSLGFSDRQVSRFSRLAGAQASLLVRMQRLADNRRGREERRRARAANGIPHLEAAAKAAAAEARKQGITVNYEGHNESNAADFARI